jgi:2-dehydro-3-deoxyphosphogluconate aldolase/(4S)-4-hydroxy-2-oxoglutarate aldolase
MAKFLRHRVIGEVLRVGLVPVFYNGEVDVAMGVVRACVEGGARLIEFTNRGDRAYHVFNELSKRCDKELPEAILGAGTVVDPPTAALYINSGANFIVGPSLNPEAARLCNRRKVLYVPGCQTPTEISEAEEIGVEIVKLFPASVLGPKFVRDLMGPSPQTLLMPSGGISLNEKEVTEWVTAGAVALNLGSALIRKDQMTEHKYGEIRENVERCIGWIKETAEKKNVKEVK